MAKVILSINVGSSSVKVSVFKVENKGETPVQIAEAQVGGLTAPPAKLDYKRGDEKVKGQKIDNVTSQENAFTYILDHLTADQGLKEISRREDIIIAAHRVVHGGDYTDAQVITTETYHQLEALSDLAPLHNAGALSVIRTCVKHLPHAKNVAYFDSAFHSTLPLHVRTYPIDPEKAKTNNLRKYGFHGISYAFITRSVAEFLGKKQSETTIVALHLGSGASACAIKHGQSVDTSMGLTPLAGLPGATRSGTIDPSLVFHYTHDAGQLSYSSTGEMHITTAEEILNKQSGWKALTGTTDFAKVSTSDDPMCKLAFDIFVDRIVGYVANYFVKLNGEVDAIVFAGGIGERSAKLRQAVIEQAKCLGFAIDSEKNESPANEVVTEVGHAKAQHRVLICQTDEQFEMARGCAEHPDFW